MHEYLPRRGLAAIPDHDPCDSEHGSLDSRATGLDQKGGHHRVERRMLVARMEPIELGPARSRPGRVKSEMGLGATDITGEDHRGIVAAACVDCQRASQPRECAAA